MTTSSSELLLSIDTGTTHCKAALFTLNGEQVAIANRPSASRRVEGGAAYYDPENFWAAIGAAVTEVVRDIDKKTIAAIGVSSMAETGLLLDRKTGYPKTPLIPWFDTSADLQTERLKEVGDAYQVFRSKGIYPSFKCSLAKILWLQESQEITLEGAIWLSAADYTVYRLSGAFATDPSLASRTYAFEINNRDWDRNWLRLFGLDSALFPPILGSGMPAGSTTPEVASQLNIPAGIPVAVCGHDHVCGALAASGLDLFSVFDSMGTAEALVGAFPKRHLGLEEYQSGLTFGCHVAPKFNYWMGGLSSSGGSVEWLRTVFGEPALTYSEMEQLYSHFAPEPGDLLYFPYLSGSGAPHSDPLTRGAFIGLRAEHNRSNIFKAVLEGAAYEIEIVRQAAVRIIGQHPRYTVAAGGSARNHVWLQIKADVSGIPIHVPDNFETTLLGTAILTGSGSGVFSDLEEAVQAVQPSKSLTVQPDPERHAQYKRIFEHGYQKLQTPLRDYYRYRFEESQNDLITT